MSGTDSAAHNVIPNWRMGYACISMPARERGIYTGRTITLKRLATLSDPVREIQTLALANIADLGTIIELNELRGFRFFRITSNLVPHLASPKLSGLASADAFVAHNSLEWARDALAAVGALIRKYGHRVSMHPGQYAQLGAIDPRIVEQTRQDLTAHALILSMLGQTPTTGAVMVIHGGGSYTDKTATLRRWTTEYLRLPESTRKYIVIENDEHQYGIDDLLPISEKYQIPLVIDWFHYVVMQSIRARKDGPQQQLEPSDPAALARVLRVWQARGIRPKMHYSEQKPDARAGAHSDCVHTIPSPIRAICDKHGIDLMLEVKYKDRCLLEIYRKYFREYNDNGRIIWIAK